MGPTFLTAGVILTNRSLVSLLVFQKFVLGVDAWPHIVPNMFRICLGTLDSSFLLMRTWEWRQEAVMPPPTPPPSEFLLLTWKTWIEFPISAQDLMGTFGQ